MKLSITDLNFCIQLLMDFPFALDEETETMLSDFLEEHYAMPGEAWHKELTGDLQPDGNEVEPWNGTSLHVKINEKVTLTVEYHPYETVCFFNDTYLGNTGGHFHLSLLTWEEFLKIVEGREQPTLLFFLLLPLVVGSKEELPVIKKHIAEQLEFLPFHNYHIPILTKYLANHVVFDDDEDNMFLEDPKAGTICKRNHSERNREKDTQTIININVAILSAMEK